MTSTDSDRMLEVVHLRKVYGGAQGTEVIRDLSFSVGDGEFVCIVGPSGAGKTTLLRSIGGLLEPTAGEVKLDGATIAGPPPGMAVVVQEYGRSLFPWMTIRQNVELPLKQKGLSKADRTRLTDSALDAVGLTRNADMHPWQLSGGMQQRAAIARAAAYEPKVLLMDEPLAAVDAQTRSDLEDLIRGLWTRLGITTIFITHDIDESIYLGQRVIVLSDRPAEVLADVIIDLPEPRDQLTTRALPRFAELRSEVYKLVQLAKRGVRPEGVEAASLPISTKVSA